MISYPISVACIDLPFPFAFAYSRRNTAALLHNIHLMRALFLLLLPELDGVLLVCRRDPILVAFHHYLSLSWFPEMLLP